MYITSVYVLLFLLKLLFNKGVHSFSKYVGITTEFWAPGGWHEARLHGQGS